MKTIMVVSKKDRASIEINRAAPNGLERLIVMRNTLLGNSVFLPEVAELDKVIEEWKQDIEGNKNA